MTPGSAGGGEVGVDGDTRLSRAGGWAGREAPGSAGRRQGGLCSVGWCSPQTGGQTLRVGKHSLLSADLTPVMPSFVCRAGYNLSW